MQRICKTKNILSTCYCQQRGSASPQLPHTTHLAQAGDMGQFPTFDWILRHSISLLVKLNQKRPHILRGRLTVWRLTNKYQYLVAILKSQSHSMRVVPFHQKVTVDS
jgi:hypothetical protein